MDPNAQSMLDAIDTLQDQQDQSILLPLTALNQATVAAVSEAQKQIVALQSRILQRVDKETTRNLDALDGLFTTVMSSIDETQFENEFLLGQLAVKGGLIQVGDQLSAALQDEAEQAPQLLYAATLYEAIESVKPMLRELIEIMAEIRDRMPPLALHVAGERTATEPQVQQQADTDTSPSPSDDGPLEQPPPLPPILWS